MIAPTARVIAFIAIGAPLALALGLYRPDLWWAAAAWAGLGLGLFIFDALAAAPLGRVRLAVSVPPAVGVGEPFPLELAIDTRGAGVPPSARISVDADPLVAPGGRLDAPLMADGANAGAALTLTAAKRGLAHIVAAWVGWTGPLGFARKQRRIAIDREVRVVPSIRAVREDGAKLFARDAQIGQRLNARLGEGSEFESLVRFMPGLDRRAIDWKQSARHADLLAKQFETERDNRIVLAVDSGRMMSDPLVTPDGVSEPRLDRAVSAALTLGYVALRLEDRVSLASFAARPRVTGREYVRLADFAQLRRAAADIDYAAEETNFTLGLASIGAALKRRAMIVLFTEFADATSAELMIRAAERLVAKHLLLFVVMTDSELENLSARVPATADDVAGATIAAELLRDRRVVLARLRRMGAHVLEVPPQGLAAGLLATYIRIKRQGMI